MAPTRDSITKPTRRSERQLVIEVNKAIKAAEEEHTAAKTGITKRKPFRRPQQRKKCFLLKKLPGEIRNQIYRYAIVQPDVIKVTAKGPGEPALLKVCRTIRHESRSLYYTENRFALQVLDWNGAQFGPFAQQFTRYEWMRTPNTFAVSAGDRKPSNLIFHFGGKASWNNLVEWIKLDNTGTALTPNMEPYESPTDYVVGGAFKLAKQFQCWPWKTVENALAAYKLGLRGTCSPWGRVEDDEDDFPRHSW